jgi:hypothetical protein
MKEEANLFRSTASSHGLDITKIAEQILLHLGRRLALPPVSLAQLILLIGLFLSRFLEIVQLAGDAFLALNHQVFSVVGIAIS